MINLNRKGHLIKVNIITELEGLLAIKMQSLIKTQINATQQN